MFRQALAEEQQKKAQAEQEFAMQQKLREEQLKESQQAQKAQQQEMDIQKQQFDLQQKINSTPVGKWIDMAGMRDKLTWVTPEMEAMTVGEVPGFTDMAMQNLASQLDPRYRFSVDQTIYEAINQGWNKEAIEGLAGNAPWVDKEQLKAAIDLRDMSPERVTDSLLKLGELRSKMMIELNDWAIDYKKNTDLAAKEKDETKKKEYQTLADEALEKLNFLPDLYVTPYENLPNYDFIKDMAYDMFDSDLIMQYPELVGIMQARPQVAGSKYAQTAMGGGTSGRLRTKGGSPSPATVSNKFEVGDVSFEAYSSEAAERAAIKKKYNLKTYAGDTGSYEAWVESGGYHSQGKGKKNGGGSRVEPL